MDESIIDIDIVGDSFGDPPSEPNEQQVPPNDHGEVPADPGHENTYNQSPQSESAQKTSEDPAGPSDTVFSSVFSTSSANNDSSLN